MEEKKIVNQFTVRITSKKVLDQLEQATVLLGKSKNELINELCAEYLGRFTGEADSEQKFIQETVNQAVKNELQPIRQALAQVMAMQFVDEKMLGSLYQQFLYFTKTQGNADLPDEYLQMFDKNIPDKFDEIKQEYFKQVFKK